MRSFGCLKVLAKRISVLLATCTAKQGKSSDATEGVTLVTSRVRWIPARRAEDDIGDVGQQ